MSLKQQRTPWQTETFVTTNATPTVSTATTFAPPTGTSGVRELHVVARNTASSEAVGVYRVMQAFKNVGGTVSLVGSVQTIYSDTVSIGGTSVTVVLLSGFINNEVVGIAATNIEWFIDSRDDVS